ncbi:MAG: cytochrome c5 family protein [Gammaproteobacteria bacterium]
MKFKTLLMISLTVILSACDQSDEQAQKPAQEAPMMKQLEAVKSLPVEKATVETRKIPVSQATQPTDTEQTMAAEPIPMGKRVYNNTCSTCHKSGIANAPKVGDKAAWAPRIAKGMDALMQSAINGVPGTSMLKKGSCFSCSDEELKSAVEYMISLSQ